MPNRPFSIRIFLPDGDPDGLRVVEKSNWTGVGVVFNRSIYRQVSKRDEFQRTGVYILVGESENSSMPTVYVGEGDPVRNRLNQHFANKDFWNWAVFFVTKDHSLNKAHVKFIEARLLELAKSAKQCQLDNSGSSLRPTLSEAESADVESFLVDMLSIFPLLGLSVFEKQFIDKADEHLLLESNEVKAKGYEDPRGFVVCEGSHAVKESLHQTPGYVTTRRKDLLAQGILEEEDGCLVFTQDQLFGSPSAAAGVILNRSTNGRRRWKSSAGVTLKEIQEQNLESD